MKFRFAIMGAGNIAAKFCQAVEILDHCEVVAVASKSKTRAEIFAEKFHIDSAYDVYEDMLKMEKVDCVYIATTPDSHYLLTALSMENKIPVLCEKAMFMNSKDAKNILTFSRKKEIFFMEAMWSRFLPAIKKGKEWLEEGKIGEANYLSIATGFAFDRTKNQRNFDPVLGGGAAFDLTVYNYELATYYFGNAIKDTKILSLWEDGGVDLSNQICLLYDRKLASLSSSCISMLDEKLIITGELGRIEIPHPHYANEVRLYNKDENLILEYRDTETVNGFTYEINEVIHCIGAGMLESPVVPHELTLKCAELFDEIYKQKPT
ncbi:MAG: Gfo/Idh/MocA family protein [Lachnospiraceae bacterium]